MKKYLKCNKVVMMTIIRQGESICVDISFLCFSCFSFIQDNHVNFENYSVHIVLFSGFLLSLFEKGFDCVIIKHILRTFMCFPKAWILVKPKTVFDEAKNQLRSISKKVVTFDA